MAIVSVGVGDATVDRAAWTTTKIDSATG